MSLNAVGEEMKNGFPVHMIGGGTFTEDELNSCLGTTLLNSVSSTCLVPQKHPDFARALGPPVDDLAAARFKCTRLSNLPSSPILGVV